MWHAISYVFEMKCKGFYFNNLISPHQINLYLYKIESRIFVKGVRIVRQCEALHMIYRRIRHDMESNMG